MSGTTQQNASFQVGRDVQVVLVASDGTRLDLSGQIEVNWRGLYNTVTHEPLNSPTRRRYLPMGHEFTLTLERRGGANEVLFAAIEQGYWAGGYPNGTQDGGTIYVYVNELDGSVSSYMGTNVALQMTDHMRADQKSALRQTVDGFASTWSVI